MTRPNRNLLRYVYNKYNNIIVLDHCFVQWTTVLKRPSEYYKYVYICTLCMFFFDKPLTFSSGVVHSILPFKYFSTVAQLKSGAYRVDGTELRPLVNSNRLFHLSCSNEYSSSSASIIIILFFSTFLASSMAACLVR